MENRIIKCRGKRKGGTEWIYGDLNHIDGKVYVFDRSETAPLNSPDWFEVEPETVGQFTGLTDKNGKDIYEFDIVSRGDRDDVMVVQWKDSSCGFEPFSDSDENCGHCGGGVNPKNIEVIGNYFEHPELITPSH